MSASPQKRTKRKTPRGTSRFVPLAAQCSAASEVHESDCSTPRPFGEREIMEYRGRPRSVRLGAGELDDLAPFLDFRGDKLAEVGGRPRKHRSTQVDKPRL